MSQCEWPDCIIFSTNLNKQISKLISFIGKCILAGGLQKHAIYTPAVKSKQHKNIAQTPFQRVHNRFGGMRDLANFCGDIRDGS